jgi:hypothetical protein
MRIINLVAAMCSILGLLFSVYVAYVVMAAAQSERLKILAFALVAVVMVMSAAICYFLWLASRTAPKNTRTVDNTPTPAGTTRDIFIAPDSNALRVTNDLASIHLTLFSCVEVDLLYLRGEVRVHREVAFVLESAEPLRIPARIPTQRTMERRLTRDEIEGVRNPGIALLEGYARFNNRPEPTRFRFLIDFLPVVPS